MFMEIKYDKNDIIARKKCHDKLLSNPATAVNAQHPAQGSLGNIGVHSNV